jgi:hypothetical protein
MIRIRKNGIYKNVSTGFSWKSLFFGVLYPAARGDFKGLFIQLVLAVITANVSQLIVPFTYNKIYLQRMIESGWRVVNK